MRMTQKMENKTMFEDNRSGPDEILDSQTSLEIYLLQDESAIEFVIWAEHQKLSWVLTQLQNSAPLQVWMFFCKQTWQFHYN